MTQTSLVVRVRGETLFEIDETFQVWVYALDAWEYAYSVVTIVNDDPTPSVSISDAAVLEGNDGTTQATFTVDLSAPCGFSIAMDYRTADGTALAGRDYAAQMGTLIFPTGATRQEVRVAVLGAGLQRQRVAGGLDRLAQHVHQLRSKHDQRHLRRARHADGPGPRPGEPRHHPRAVVADLAGGGLAGRRFPGAVG
jgi:hypothetical protein